MEKLNIVKENNKVKVVVLRVNFFGGFVLILDIIVKKVKELVEEKFVYVLMLSVVVFGGYYIFINVYKIFVDRNIIIGFIGVVSILLDFLKLIIDNGVNIEKIFDGEYFDLYLVDSFIEKKYNKIYNLNLKVYEDFLSVVLKGRRIDKEKLKIIVEGRIWIGDEVIKIGLVDEIGGLNEIIYVIVEDNNMDEYGIVIVKDKFELGNIYKKYLRYIKMNVKDLVKEKIFKDYLYNKLVIYLFYDVLD